MEKSFNENAIKNLEEEITLLKTEMNTKLSLLESKLHKLIDNGKSNQSTPQIKSDPYKTSTPKITAEEENSSNKEEISKTEILTKKKEKSKIEIYITILLSFIPDLLSKLVNLIDPVKKIYTQYKNEDKLTEFFMIIFGIMAFVIGFGYLLQYSFSNIFSPITKLIISLIATNLLLLLAKWIYHKKDFEEYAYSIMGLSLSLNYLIAYFIISYYEIMTLNQGIILISLNILLGIYLSNKYNSMVIVLIAFLGAVLTPFAINFEIYTNSIYLLYLFLISLPIVLLTKDNQILKMIALFAFISIIELNIYYNFKADIFAIIVLNLFFYLYLYIGLYQEKLNARLVINKYDLIVIITTFINFIYILFESVENTQLLSSIYFINFTILSLFAYSKIIKANMQKTVLIVLSSVFLALSVLLLLNFKYTAIIWIIEALLLIYLGFKQELNYIKQEGYILYIIALISLLNTIYELFIFNEINLLSHFFIQLFILGIASYFIKYIISHFQNTLQTYEKTILKINNEFISIWQISVFGLVGYSLIEHYILVFIPYLSFYFFYKGETHNLKLTTSLGYIVIVISLIEYYLSINYTQSFRFSHQTLSAQVVLIQFFLSLWIMQFFYEKFLPNGILLEKMKQTRIVFYFLLPLVYLPSIFKYYFDYFTFALCLSVLISIVINDKIKKAILQKQLKFLFFSSLFYFTYNYYAYEDISGLFGLIFITLVCFVLIYSKNILNPRIYKNIEYKTIINNSYFILLLTIGTITYHYIDNIPLILKGLSILSLVFLSYKNKNIIIKKEFELYYFTATVLIPIFIYLDLTLEQNPLIVLSSTLIYLVVFYFIGLNSKSYQLFYNRYIFHSIILVLYTSASILYEQLFFISIFMVIQALICLFIYKKELEYFYKVLFGLSFIKIAIYDTANFSLVEKMLVFSIIGVLLIISAYLVIKKNKGEKNV